MEKNESYFINEAYKEAKKACKEDEVPIGAVIVKDGKIIARAHNRKEHKGIAINHAEILSIVKANKKLGTWHLDGCIMYVTLEPCTMCAGALIQSRIKKVVYLAKSHQDGSIESAFCLFDVKGLNHYVECEYIECVKCSEIISDYFKSKRHMV